jgi:hypothetical protein
MDHSQKRDYEKEREDLLRLIKEQTPKEIKEAIEITISAQQVEKPPEIKISHKGAYDAD